MAQICNKAELNIALTKNRLNLVVLFLLSLFVVL